jgi:probable rRNA maturation factor
VREALRFPQRTNHPSLTLSVQYAVPAAGLPARSTLRRWAQAALDRDATVTLRFVGRAEGQRLNARFRGKDYATNVLTFVYDDRSHDAFRDAPGVFPVAGDIVICVPVARREARAAGRPFRAHCAHLVVHGLLHLQGCDHESEPQATRMERREAEVLARFRYPDPYAITDAMTRERR